MAWTSHKLTVEGQAAGERLSGCEFGDRAEQRERSHCDAVAKAASANPAGSSGPGMFFESPQMEVKRPELCTPSLTSHPVDCLQGEGITLGEAAKGNTPGRNLTMNPRKTALWQLQE